MALSSLSLNISVRQQRVPTSDRIGFKAAGKMRRFWGQSSHFVSFCLIHFCLFLTRGTCLESRARNAGGNLARGRNWLEVDVEPGLGGTPPPPPEAATARMRRTKPFFVMTRACHNFKKLLQFRRIRAVFRELMLVKRTQFFSETKPIAEGGSEAGGAGGLFKPEGRPLTERKRRNAWIEIRRRRFRAASGCSGQSSGAGRSSG